MQQNLFTHAGVKIRAGSWKLPESFFDLLTGKNQKRPAQEKTFLFSRTFKTKLQICQFFTEDILWENSSKKHLS